ELEKLQGTWSLVSSETNGQQISGEDRSYLFTFKGDTWSIHVNGRLSQAGTVRQIEVKAKHNAIDLPITEGGNVGTTAKSLSAVNGAWLKERNGAQPRATDFPRNPGHGRLYSIFRRGKPEAARPPEVRFESATFPTDLLVPESKGAIRRVVLTCRPADGQAGTLALDPNAPRFDAFGDPVAGGKPSPVVTLDCTLKLVKAGKDRQLFELRGPKLL